MTAFKLSLAADGTLTNAADDAALGPAAGGARVYAVTGCPPIAGPGDILSLARGYVPPAGAVEVPFDRLAERLATQNSGSCCGGGCGG